MWDPYAEFESATLPNGLTIHAAHWPNRPWQAMGFLVHSGAEHDPIGLEGVAHFVEHLVSHNTNVTYEEIDSFFQDHGGSARLGITDGHATEYTFFAPAQKDMLAKAFSIFGTMLLTAKLDNYIERERAVIIGEFNRKFPTAISLELRMRARKALYSGYWMQRSASSLGTLETIKQITQKDVQAYYDTHYTPQNISIVGVGGMKLAELVELLSESPFAIQKTGIRTELPRPTHDAPPPSENRYIFNVSEHMATKAPHKVGAYSSSAKIPGAANPRAIRIMRGVLDTVLNDEVREKRAWTYSIYSSQHTYRQFYKFNIDCESLAIESLATIESVIEDCIASIKNREDLFEQNKQWYLTGSMLMDPTGRGIRDGALHDLGNYQKIITTAEHIRQIKEVTMDDYRDLFQWLRPEQRWTMIARP